MVKNVEVTRVSLQEITIRTGKKGEPTVTPMAQHEYQFEIDDPYPATFWLSRQHQAVAVFGEYRQEYVGADENGEEKYERWLRIQSVLDLGNCG